MAFGERSSNPGADCGFRVAEAASRIIGARPRTDLDGYGAGRKTSPGADLYGSRGVLYRCHETDCRFQNMERRFAVSPHSDRDARAGGGDCLFSKRSWIPL